MSKSALQVSFDLKRLLHAARRMRRPARIAGRVERQMREVR
ncbi:MAG: hypothetical protein AVDCRST_MAG71-1701 [uncultured Lysobacter sp.]|uniref:Uncharacterized protein n=1 Tax=uncultured Lysobacter sp. TaxID=271060 RepID=A0A6J4LCD9_9GAMM|nr:MAG: hypothetical protein AVDCRST_MAG71-1701 [uncultured Lysobacter sp.]